MERVAIFGLLDLELEASGTGTVTLSTDLPGNAMAARETKPLPHTSTRRVVRFRLQGTSKGRLYSIKVKPDGGGIIRLYGGRIWARVLPDPQWRWYAIPIPPTSEEWTAQPLPIPPSGEWTAVKFPIEPTPANPVWVSLPIDQ
jgi:hypothetical protein